MAVNEPLRIGIAGFGNAAQLYHVPALLELSTTYEVVAVADPSEANRSVASELLRLPASSVYGDVGAMLAGTALDVIDVCTPPSIRREIVEPAIARGINIICEKPLALTPREAAKLEDIVGASTIAFAMFHNYIHLPEYASLLDAVRSGRLGRVEVVNIIALGIEDLPGTASYQPAWRHNPSMSGGGILIDLMHFVYVAEAILGAPLRRVVARTWARDPSSLVEDIALCRFDSEGGSAIVNVGWGRGPGGVLVSGTEGRGVIRYRDADPFAPPEEIFIVDETGRSQLPIGAPTTGHREVLADLARSISAGNPTRMVREGFRALEAVMGAYESAATGLPVDLPLNDDDPVYQDGVEGLERLSRNEA